MRQMVLLIVWLKERKKNKGMKATVNGKTFNLPTSWAEVPFYQFILLKGDTSDILSIFTGIPAPEIRRSQVKNADKVLAALSFIDTQKFGNAGKTFMGLPIPKDLNFSQIGRFEDAKLALKDCPEGQEVTRYPEIVTALLMPDYFEATDEQKAAFQERVSLQPCEEVVSIGTFFLLKLVSLRLNINLNSLNRPSMLTRLRLVWRAFLVRMDFMGRFYTWKA